MFIIKMTKILKIAAFMALLHCGFTSSRVISTLYALHYGQPAWMVGVILSTYAAIPALISIHVGKFIDKIGVRIPITVSFLMISAAESFCSRHAAYPRPLTNLRLKIIGITVPLNYSKMRKSETFCLRLPSFLWLGIFRPS